MSVTADPKPLTSRPNLVSAPAAEAPLHLSLRPPPVSLSLSGQGKLAAGWET